MFSRNQLKYATYILFFIFSHTYVCPTRIESAPGSNGNGVLVKNQISQFSIVMFSLKIKTVSILRRHEFITAEFNVIACTKF